MEKNDSIRHLPATPARELPPAGNPDVTILLHSCLVFLFVVAGFSLALGCASADDLACLSCHSAPGFSKVDAGGRTVSLEVKLDELTKSAHAGIGCLGCHSDLRDKGIPHPPNVKPVICLPCHSQPGSKGSADARRTTSFTDNIHIDQQGRAFQNAPACKQCHGAHEIRRSDDPASNTNRANSGNVCVQCHQDLNSGAVSPKSYRAYSNGLHARLRSKNSAQGSLVTCVDCHRVHYWNASATSASSVSRGRVPDTCGRCHKQELLDYTQSVHGLAFARGVDQSPVCSDCHSEHSPDADASRGQVIDVCSKCHEDVRLQKRLGIPAGRLASYNASFHGVANKFGDTTAANCASCHGSHRVLPSSDPRSAVNKKNLPATCGKCHPGATENFAKGSIHVIPSPKQDAIVFWVKWLYTLFVVGVLSSFVAYIILDISARVRGRLPWRRGVRRA